MVNNQKIVKSPGAGRLLLFFIISFVHCGILLIVMTNHIYLIIVVVEILFYIIFKHGKIKNIIRIMIIVSSIGFINALMSDGKIVFQLWKITITNEGLIFGAQKGGLLLLLFLFTNNTLSGREEQIGNAIATVFNKTGYIVMSLVVFFSLWRSFTREISINRWLIQCVRLLKQRQSNMMQENNVRNCGIIDFRFILYQVVFLSATLLITIFILLARFGSIL